MKKLCAALLAAAICITPFSFRDKWQENLTLTASASDISQLPSDYKNAADWIWETRILGEKSVEAWDTIYDKIVAGNGTLHYVVKWQSYDTITLQQRQNLQQVLEKAINDWTDWLVGYENWPYEHVQVKIVGWAVLDKNCLQDLQPDEVVYTDTIPYDPTYDIENGMGNDSMLTIEPIAPSDLFRYDHWRDSSWDYQGSYDNRFDMYLTAAHGMIDMGGYGYYWGQQLSDNAILGLCDGTTSVHILEHEIGHGFGFTDFYGAEGESDGTPPGGFPDGKGSLMEAGSSSVITNFDGWFARYVWSKISAEEGRFDLTQKPVETTTTAVITTTTMTTVTTEATTETSKPEGTTTTLIYDNASFTDTISDIGDSYVTFEKNGTFHFQGTEYYHGDESMNLAHYEIGDKISIQFSYETQGLLIANITTLTLEENSHKIPGDVDQNHVCNLADLVAMQQFLLGNGTLTDWEAGDLYVDNKINGFDLAVLRQILLGQTG